MEGDKSKIAIVIEAIKTDSSYNSYFFKNIHQMKSPEKWFDSLYYDQLLNTSNQLALPYIRLVITGHKLDTNDKFIELLNLWLDGFLSLELNNINVMWFLEKIIEIKNEDILEKCRKIIIKYLSEQNLCYDVLMQLSINKFDNFTFSNVDFAFQIIELIIAYDSYDNLSKNQYALEQIRNKYCKQLVIANREKLLDIVTSEIFNYLNKEPYELLIKDTIDQHSSFPNYTDYLLDYLLLIINLNSNKENLELINYFKNIIDNNELVNQKKNFILKIIIFLIGKTESFNNIVYIQEKITDLNDLSSIKYALYRDVLALGKDKFTFLPDFENWLSSLSYSSEFKSHVDDEIKLKQYELQLKLELLKIFENKSTYYKENISFYPYQINLPESSVSFKASWTSPNNLLDFIAQSSINDIIDILNGNKQLPETDFPDLHLEESIKNDLQYNPQKYMNGNLRSIFTNVVSYYHKTRFIYEIAGLNQKEANPLYKEFIDLCFVATNDQIYFTSVITLIDNLINQKEDLTCYFDQIESFILNSIFNIKDNDELDTMGGGRNSPFGKSILILINIHIQKNNHTLEEFVNCLENKYIKFLENKNSLYALGQYLYYLFKIEKFKAIFYTLDKKFQKVILSAHIKYCQHVQKELFEISKQYDFMEDKESRYRYSELMFFMYLFHEDNFFIDCIDRYSDNKEVISAIASSIHAYKNQIIEINASSRVVIDIWGKLLQTPYLYDISNMLLFNLDIVDIDNDEQMGISIELIESRDVMTLSYLDDVLNFLNTLYAKGKFKSLLEILIKMVNNYNNNFYLMPIDNLDKLIYNLDIAISRHNYGEYEKLVELKRLLKSKNYPLILGD